MTHINVQELGSTEVIDITEDPEFKKNRAMMARGERIMSDPDAPEIAKEEAKKDIMRHAMRNIRLSDGLVKSDGQVENALEPGQDELLLEASNPDDEQ